jgi:hypothetical protein
LRELLFFAANETKRVRLGGWVGGRMQNGLHILLSNKSFRF